MKINMMYGNPINHAKVFSKPWKKLYMIVKEITKDNRKYQHPEIYESEEFFRMKSGPLRNEISDIIYKNIHTSRGHFNP